ncbi:uncharacterized protein KY384_000702 [Bacidia gigantensis]|uniref:uncharacterized protein n=1 Tax=Bacidia gigantensis TaxID=2732470 RepID=UPI001D051612|nr:uncharacterized protein KY384_000702 [Bacidia gigantensis]KAG8525940.1 hypothetical protein KY384_000702 [Bacidia gigantensis]
MSYRESRDYKHRSRSPRRDRRPDKRSRSPAFSLLKHRIERQHSDHHISAGPRPGVLLPFRARMIVQHDLTEYKPLFGLYLDIQKHKFMEEMPEHEVKGRWKSFLGKWNRGELAEGWYDPLTLQKAKASANQPEGAAPPEPTVGEKLFDADRQEHAHASDDEELGPALPNALAYTQDRGTKLGPAIPNSQDLILQRELVQEDAENQRNDLRYERKLDRREQKERQDELVPRADSDTKGRMLEKKKEKAASNRDFAAGKTEAGGMAELPDSDLLGDAEDGVEGLKRRKAEMQNKKSERELRKEEALRLRAEEREERIRAYREKEARTMSGLVALAKAKFG